MYRSLVQAPQGVRRATAAAGRESRAVFGTSGHRRRASSCRCVFVGRFGLCGLQARRRHWRGRCRGQMQLTHDEKRDASRRAAAAAPTTPRCAHAHAARRCVSRCCTHPGSTTPSKPDPTTTTLPTHPPTSKRRPRAVEKDLDWEPDLKRRPAAPPPRTNFPPPPPPPPPTTDTAVVS